MRGGEEKESKGERERKRERDFYLSFFLTLSPPILSYANEFGRENLKRKEECSKTKEKIHPLTTFLPRISAHARLIPILDHSLK